MFKPNENADTKFSSLLTEVDVTTDKMVAVFGTSHSYYDDPEKGYDGPEWYFEDENQVVFTVYSRWGQYRVGGVDHKDSWNEVDPADFVNWLEKQVK